MDYLTNTQNSYLIPENHIYLQCAQHAWGMCRSHAWDPGLGRNLPGLAFAAESASKQHRCCRALVQLLEPCHIRAFRQPLAPLDAPSSMESSPRPSSHADLKLKGDV